MIPDGRITNPEVVLDNAYLMEVEANCRMFLMAWNSIQERARDAPSAGPDSGAQSRLRIWTFESWGDAYAMIGAARRISRVLWEVEGCKEFRARHKLPLSPALRPSYLTPLRDALEHLETRIHVFVTAHMDVPMSGWGVSNDPADEPPSDRFRYRHLNSVTGRCTAYGCA